MEGMKVVVAGLKVLIPALAWKYTGNPRIGSVRIIGGLLNFKPSS
jgi:hypothetical protein